MYNNQLKPLPQPDALSMEQVGNFARGLARFAGGMLLGAVVVGVNSAAAVARHIEETQSGTEVHP